MKWDSSKYDVEQKSVREIQHREAKDATEKRRLRIYLISSVLGFYLVWAFFAPIVAPMLEQAEHYCAEWYSPDGESLACGEYVNDTEAYIASHNLDMRYRNIYLILVLFALLSLINWSYLCISRYQAHGDGRPSVRDNLIEASVYAVLTAFAVLLFNNLVLYSMSEMKHGWYPEIFDLSEAALAAHHYYYSISRY